MTKLFSEIVETKTVSKIENLDQQYLIKLLALVIIKKIEEENIEDFLEEQDAQNKLNILSEGIHQIQEIQKYLVLYLPDIKSSIFTELELPAAHFQSNDNQRIEHVLDRLASKAFQLASETHEELISSKEIEDQIFSPIFDISKALGIGKEETRLYLDAIEKKIKNIKNVEKVASNVKSQDILPINKYIPTSLFLLGIGHFGDVKTGFLPSGEQKVIKVVRSGSTNNAAKRKSHKDAWDERDDDLNRELIGLSQSRKLISYGETSSYLKKITKEKKELLLVTDQALDVNDAFNERTSTSKTAIVKRQQEQPSLSYMCGKATHILMEFSGSKDLREEINEKMLEEIPKGSENFKNYCRYFMDRAIECCSIIEQQHKLGTHNNFKPANIVIT